MSNNMAPATQMKFFIKDTVWKVKYSEVTHSIKFQIWILLQKVCLK